MDGPDRNLVEAALRKRAAGEALTRAEQSTLSRWEKHREQVLRDQYYATVPQKDYARLSGRQPKILKEQEQAHGIPCGGAVVDLAAVLSAFHDLLAKYKHAIAAEYRGDGVESPHALAKRRMLTAKADLAEYQLAIAQGSVVARDQAARERGLIVQWAVSVFNRAGAELAPRLAGRGTAEVKDIVANYFDAVRRDALAQQNGKDSHVGEVVPRHQNNAKPRSRQRKGASQRRKNGRTNARKR